MVTPFFLLDSGFGGLDINLLGLVLGLLVGSDLDSLISRVAPHEPHQVDHPFRHTGIGFAEFFRSVKI